MGQIKNNKQYIISSMAFPPIVEFAKIVLFKNARIDQHEHYIKRTSRNRFTILSPNGPQCLSIPLVKGKNRGTRMIDVQISNDTNWQIKHLRSIITAYGSAPFFPYYIDVIEGLFNQKQDSLLDFNNSTVKTISQLLNIPTKLVLTDRYYEEGDQKVTTFRKIFHPAEKTIEYNTLELAKYQQVFSDRFEFVSNLSILDLLFCLGPESGQYLKGVFDQFYGNMINSS